MHLFLKSQFNRLLREACRAARDIPGTEICGLLVDTGLYLSFVPVRNVSPRVGSFVFSVPHARRITAAAKVLGQEIVGSFHSHPVGLAIPGKSDIENSVDDSLMVLFDCLGREGQLWKIRNNKARSLEFGLLESKPKQLRF